MALDEARRFIGGVDAGAEHGTALADDVDQDEAGTAAGVAALVVCEG